MRHALSWIEGHLPFPGNSLAPLVRLSHLVTSDDQASTPSLKGPCFPEDVRFCSEDVRLFPSKNGSHSGIFKAAMEELCRVTKCSQNRHASKETWKNSIFAVFWSELERREAGRKMSLKLSPEMSPLSLDEKLIHQVSLRQEAGNCKDRAQVVPFVTSSCPFCP